MRVLAFDPGPSKTGYAIVEVSGPSVRLLEAGWVDSLVPVLSGLLVHSQAEFVVLEAVEGYAFSPARSAALIATAVVEGTIRGLVAALNLNLMSLSARSWRRILLGKPNASDADIKPIVEGRVSNLPKRTNAHVRDALGLTLAWAQEHL